MTYIKKRQEKRLVFFSALMIIILSTPWLLTNCNKKVIPKKQIILISVDTLRGDHLSSYGYSRDTTPNLSRLVADSVYYTHAYTNGCWTMPAHMSLLTGTLPSRHGINRDWGSITKRKKYPKLNNPVKSIAEVLKSHHITTIKYAHLPDELGFNNGFDRNHRVDPFDNNKISARLLQELEDNKEKDFFLFIHTWRVHAPYSNSYFQKEGKIDKEKRAYINNFRLLSKNSQRPTIAFKNFLKENDLFNVNDCITFYDGGIRYVDRYIGKIINKSRQLGIYDDLLIIVVSDHGEHFKEHFPDFYNDHGRDFYEEFIKVPLIIKYPAQTIKPATLHQPVSLIDVVPTILDFYHIKSPSFIQGKSLLKLKSGKNSGYIVSEAISTGKIEKKMIRVGHLKYIITMKNPSGPARVNWKAISRRQLFDLKNDPLEKNDLYKDLKSRRTCIELEKALIKIVKNSRKTHRSMNETSISQETIKQLEALGYL